MPTMQKTHPPTERQTLPPAGPPTARPGLFDRYRPSAVAALVGAYSFQALLETDWFPALLLCALPDFLGDATDALAMLDETHLYQAVARIQPVSAAELEAAFPVLSELAAKLGLAHEESLVLAFLAQAQGDPFWEQWDGHLGHGTRRRSAGHLAAALGLGADTVRRALESDSPLMSSSLFAQKFFIRHAKPLDHFALCPEFDADMLRSSAAWSDFFRARFDIAAPRQRAVDFSHLEDDLRTATGLLQGALRAGLPGTHVLLYGPPGTGKTTLAFELARRLGAELLVVRKEFALSGPSDGEERLRNFNLGQRLGSAGAVSLMLFDELEDLLPAEGPGAEHGRAHKGWICQALEQARVPTIWTANAIRGIDPAILRRFSLTLQVGVPPRSFRRRLLGEALAPHGISAPWCDRLARLDCLTPAMTAQLSELAVALPLTGAELEVALDRWLAERLRAQGRTMLPPVAAPCRFRCELLNTDTNPQRLIEGLGRSGEGRLCLHGPPGTGKTAFAQHLAERLDLPVLLRRGSDLRSAYVGETERNLAQMFTQAARDGAVLILDEADSFLSTRSGRHQRWEANETSEFLVQLESFRGIFCATTNRFEDLDPAFMRRFDLKIAFDYLDEAQRERFMKNLLRKAGYPVRLKAATRQRLARLDELTPGDFSAASRKLRFSGQAVSQDNLLSALVHEVACKNIHKGRPIGFRWAE